MNLTFNVALLTLVYLYAFHDESLDSVSTRGLFFKACSSMISAGVLVMFAVDFCVFMKGYFQGVGAGVGQRGFLVLPTSGLRGCLNQLLGVAMKNLLLALNTAVVTSFVRFLFDFVLAPKLRASVA